MKQSLTHSRQDCFKTCRKKHWFAYEMGIRSEVDSKALRMGSAFHEGLELLGTVGEAEAVQAVRNYYSYCPEKIDQYDWDMECETVARLICAYAWKWGSELEIISAEESFSIDLTNPETGKASKIFDLRGKIDGICRLEDGRLVVRECKLLGESIDDSSQLWERLKVDHQISLYVIAARRLGYEVDSVLYDVTRKPTIKPEQVAVKDKLGAKIVLDKHGDRVKTERGLYRQTGDKSKGYVLQTRNMTVEEWGEKLTDDIVGRPEFYFARKEIPRLDKDLQEYERELWSIQQTMRAAQRDGLHYRTCNKDTCSWCQYFGLCTAGWTPEQPVPFGFIKVENIHPELDNDSNEISTTSNAATAESYW